MRNILSALAASAALLSITALAVPASAATTTIAQATAAPSDAMKGDAMKGDAMKGGAMKGDAMAADHGRFGGTVDSGKPKLQLTLATIVAGGGPANYKTTTLLGVLAGPKLNAEVASLSKKFGKPAVGQFIKTFDFVIADSLKIVTAAKVPLPKTPAPNPKNGKALAAALYTAGVDPSAGFNVEYMLDHLVTHPVHVQVMKDIDAKYGLAADASYHAVLTQAMSDLKAVYGL